VNTNSVTKRFEPWDVPSESRGLRYLVRFVNRAYIKLVEVELRKHVDITYAQWSYIRCLSAEDGLSQRELSDRNGLMENTTFVALNRMEARGWVRRQRDEQDKRRWLICLTDRGRALSKLHPLVERTARVAIKNVPPETVTFLQQGLQQMLGNLEGALEKCIAAPSPAPRARKRKRIQVKSRPAPRTKRHGTPQLEAR
jgi:DNA-binding MarR family transcriptional regulator